MEDTFECLNEHAWVWRAKTITQLQSQLFKSRITACDNLKILFILKRHLNLHKTECTDPRKKLEQAEQRRLRGRLLRVESRET